MDDFIRYFRPIGRVAMDRSITQLCVQFGWTRNQAWDIIDQLSYGHARISRYYISDFQPIDFIPAGLRRANLGDTDFIRFELLPQS